MAENLDKIGKSGNRIAGEARRDACRLTSRRYSLVVTHVIQSLFRCFALDSFHYHRDPLSAAYACGSQPISVSSPM
jgi:hypothetical protein